jgi:uncharacterized membrane protein
MGGFTVKYVYVLFIIAFAIAFTLIDSFQTGLLWVIAMILQGIFLEVGEK